MRRPKMNYKNVSGCSVPVDNISVDDWITLTVGNIDVPMHVSEIFGNINVQSGRKERPYSEIHKGFWAGGNFIVINQEGKGICYDKTYTREWVEQNYTRYKS